MSTTATLVNSITATQLNIPCTMGVLNMPEQGGVVTIDSETILYTMSSEDGLFTCTRGYNSTTPAVHSAGALVTLLYASAIASPFILAADPTQPTEGQMWYNTTSHVMKYFDNGTVRTISHS
jgi:hypothetical protein